MNRYKLDIGNNPNEWVCTDQNHGIVCVFKNGAYNQTQKFTELEDSAVKLGADKLAVIAKEMGNWLFENHYDKLVINYRQFIASRIKEERTKAGLTQEQLATLSGITQSNLARIENSRYNMTIDTLGNIAEALNLKIDFIVK